MWIDSMCKRTEVLYACVPRGEMIEMTEFCKQRCQHLVRELHVMSMVWCFRPMLLKVDVYSLLTFGPLVGFEFSPS